MALEVVKRIIGWPTAERIARENKRMAAREQVREHARRLLGENIRFDYPLRSDPGPVKTEDGIQVGAVSRDGRALVVEFREIGRTE